MKQVLISICLFMLIAGLFPLQVHAYEKYSQFVVVYSSSSECGPKVEKASDANKDYYLDVSSCDSNFRDYPIVASGGFTFWKINYSYRGVDNWAFGYAWDGNFISAIIQSFLVNPVCYCICGVLIVLSMIVLFVIKRRRVLIKYSKEQRKVV